MDQVSLPMRIALLAVLAFAGLWFVALRPKPPESAPPPPAPSAASGITSAPGKATSAVGEANAATAARTGASSAATPAAAAAKTGAKATPATAKAKPAASAADPVKDGEPKQSRALKRVLGDLDAKRTVVLLFWDGKTAVDREVRRAVAGADRHDGRVKVHVQRLSKLGAFEPITRGVPVVSSPTVLVIGRDRKARSVAGLTTRNEVDELVDRAIAGK